MRRLFVQMDKKMFFVCILAAFAPVFLMSKCSPLYPFNDWYDINQIFSVGKGMIHGKVPYADLVDQKGPYAYLLTAAAYLISHCTFTGVFVLEVINFFIYSVCMYKLIRLYIPQPAEIAWMIPVLSTVIISSTGFVHGGSMEEFGLGILSYALYSLMKIFHEDPQTGGKGKEFVLLVNGILAGLLFWTKFTMTGFYIVWIVFFLLIIREKTISSLALFGGGACIATIPWIIYFGLHHAIGDWMSLYIYNNIFGYGKMQSRTVAEILSSIPKCLGEYLLYRGNFGVLLFLVMGMLFLVMPKSHSKMIWKEKICLALMALITVLGAYAGGFDYGYYGLLLCVFLGYGAAACLLGIQWIRQHIFRGGDDSRLSRKVRVVFMCLVNVCVLVLGFYTSDNTYLLKIKKSDMPQFQFAKIIMEAPKDRQVLLNYGFWTGGIHDSGSGSSNEIFCVSQCGI